MCIEKRQLVDAIQKPGACLIFDLILFFFLALHFFFDFSFIFSPPFRPIFDPFLYASPHRVLLTTKPQSCSCLEMYLCLGKQT